MQKQRTEVKVPLIVTIIMAALIILSIFTAIAFGIQNKRHKDDIEIYEEYYVLVKEIDIMYREWRDWYQQYSETEYFLKFNTEKYLRYLELEKIIGEMKK